HSEAEGATSMRLEVIPWSGKKPPNEREVRERLEAEGYETFQWHDPPEVTYEPHAHDRDEVLWVVIGRITFGIGGEDWTLGPGDRLMLPKGTVHTARTGAEGAMYWIGERHDR
ncbi:MAG: cupin domain-containing protein, partial [Candidatus Binatia bacterium]